MHAIEVVLALFAAVAILAYLAARLKVPYPIFLVLGGLALSFIPNLPRITLAPDLVFILFLPPILYYAGLMTSWRDFKANARPIGLLAFGLVLFTTALVGVAAHYLIGMPWAAAFVLGAIVSPPDAVAATAIMSRMRLPNRIITILEGESLVNDATALVAYRIAIVAVVSGQFSPAHGAFQFLYVALGGVAVGLLAGWLVARVRPHLRDDGIEGLVSLLTPYVAYLPAEHAGVSGVLAAVAAGIYMSRRIPQITTGHTRLKLYAVWDAWIFILNGLVFILIGLQLPTVLERLRDQSDVAHLARDAILISLLVIALRMLWVFPATYAPRRLIKAVRERDPAPPFGSVFVVAWTGLRGIVSLAAALALPERTATGAPFPHRDYIIFITFAVILVTLVVQGLSLPLVIKWANLREDDAEEREELRARYEGVHAAMARLDALEMLGEATPQAVAPVRADLQRQERYLSSQLTGADGDGNVELLCATQQAARRESLAAQQGMILKLRDDGVIGDEVLRRLQAELDHEESRLADA